MLGTVQLSGMVLTGNSMGIALKSICNKYRECCIEISPNFTATHAIIVQINQIDYNISSDMAIFYWYEYRTAGRPTSLLIFNKMDAIFLLYHKCYTTRSHINLQSGFLLKCLLQSLKMKQLYT